MKNILSVLAGILVMFSLLLPGCSDENSSTPTSASLSAGRIEGQLVADAGVVVAKLLPAQNAVNNPQGDVYPVSGATVELLRDGTVIATTTTDEYGRFYFSGLEPGNYEVRVVSNDGSEAHYHIYVEADQTVTVYGRVVPEGYCYWDEQPGSNWDDMPNGPHWGGGYCGVSPGQGYWHNGEEWQGPGTGPHGPHAQ